MEPKPLLLDAADRIPPGTYPPGRTLLCVACGTRVRVGQPHTAVEPYPHQTYEALIVHGPTDDGYEGRTPWARL